MYNEREEELFENHQSSLHNSQKEEKDEGASYL